MNRGALYPLAGAWIRHQAAQLQLPLVDAEALHDRRVAARRLRTACAVFPEAVPGRRLGKELKRLTRLLGAVRQWDVLAIGLAQLRDGAADPGAQASLEFLQERARKRRNRSWQELQAAPPVPGLFRALKRFAGRLEGWAEPEVPRLTEKALQPLLQAAFGSLADLLEAEQAEPMHQARRAFKRCRYAVELLQPAFPEGAEDFLAQARAIQTRLGDHHDQVVLQTWLEAEQERLERLGRATLCAELAKLLERGRRRREELYQAFRALAGDISGEQPYSALGQAF